MLPTEEMTNLVIDLHFRCEHDLKTSTCMIALALSKLRPYNAALVILKGPYLLLPATAAHATAFVLSVLSQLRILLLISFVLFVRGGGELEEASPLVLR